MKAAIAAVHSLAADAALYFAGLAGVAAITALICAAISFLLR